MNTFCADDFPSAEQLPKLSMLWMSSVPADVAKAVKAGFRQAAAQGLNLRIVQPRKPEWLAENLHNPFRNWDGRAHIPASHAKKAAQAYRQLLASTRTIDATIDQIKVREMLPAMVGAYVAVFNQLDRRSGVIETEEREEISAVLSAVLGQLLKQLGVAGKALVDEAVLQQQFDALREF